MYFRVNEKGSINLLTLNEGILLFLNRLFLDVCWLCRHFYCM